MLPPECASRPWWQRCHLRRHFPIRPTRTFPKQPTYSLSDGTLVTGFRCEVGEDEVIEGRVKPKADAKLEYTRAVADQQVAAILEEHTPEVFEVKIGNVPSNTVVKVLLTCVSELAPDAAGKGLRFVLPTSIAPRYGTPPAGISNPHKATSGNGLEIVVNVESSSAIRQLASPSHPIAVEVGGSDTFNRANSFIELATGRNQGTFNLNRAQATLSDRNAILEKDFHLTITSTDEDDFKSSAVLETSDDDDQAALMVRLYPRSMLASDNHLTSFEGEIILVADRSGSMMVSSKMATLRDALGIFLRSLPESSHFNILSFGSLHEQLWNSSAKYSQETLAQAVAYVTSRFEANLGGTEILAALEQAVKSSNADCTSTQIILLPDGESWNTDDIIRFVQKTRSESDGRTRFFAIGIGNTVSHSLINGIGKQGGGYGELVSLGTSNGWEANVIQMLKSALSPTSCTFSLRLATKNVPHADTGRAIESSAYTQTPYETPAIPYFGHQSAFLMFDRTVCKDLDGIHIVQQSPRGESEHITLPILRPSTSSKIIRQLAAKALPTDITAEKTMFHIRRSSSQAPSPSNEGTRQHAESLATKYQITSAWTSFVATRGGSQVESSARFYKARMADLVQFQGIRAHIPISSGQMLIPFQMCDYYDDTMQRQSRTDIMPLSEEVSQDEYVDTWSFASPQSGSPIFVPSYEGPATQPDSAHGLHCTPVIPTMPCWSPKTLLNLLVRAQNYNGAFEFSRFGFEEIHSRFFGPNASTCWETFEYIEAHVNPNDKISNTAILVMHTVLALCILSTIYKEDAHLWHLMVLKATSWLQHVGLDETWIMQEQDRLRTLLCVHGAWVREADFLRQWVLDSVLGAGGRTTHDYSEDVVNESFNKYFEIFFHEEAAGPLPVPVSLYTADISQLEQHDTPTERSTKRMRLS